ncbi:MAG: rRNA pseudouridine synthase [Chloroflexi bacterium]|nr:rRNA pseudouridine synthase [Chloroflexota bacterium]
MRVEIPPEGGERLQKVLARAGVASRRACEELITAGRVTVNGRVVTQLGTKVDALVDSLAVDGKPVDANRQSSYYILYKPRGYITSADDPEGRRQASDLVPGDERLNSVGRLDMDSEGLLLFTNDGALALRLTHPRYQHEKEYLVLCDAPVAPAELRQMAQGIMLEGETSPCRAVVRTLPPETEWLGQAAGAAQGWLSFTMRQGRKRQIRRMLEYFGHHVFRLVRIRIGKLRLGTLRPGQGRFLRPAEIHALRASARLEQPAASAPPASRRKQQSEAYNDRNRRSGGLGQKHSRRSPRN